MIRRHVVFLHVPKTGGTAVRNALARALTDHRRLFDYGAQTAETSPEIRAHVYGTTPPAVPDDFLDRVDDGRPILLAGHFRGARYWPHFSAESFVTFLRDPVDRIFSEYNHLVRHRGLDQTLEDFAARARPRIITKLLEKTDPMGFGFIGFTDTIAEDSARLSEFVGCEITVERENEGHYLPEVAERAADPAFREWIAAQIGGDLELYRRIRERFWRRRRRVERHGRTAGVLRGRIRRFGDAGVVGYAVNPGRETMLPVEVRIAGNLVATVTADQRCPALKTRALSRTGFGGFAVSLAPWLEPAGKDHGEVVTVRFADTGEELAGSPIRVAGRFRSPD